MQLATLRRLWTSLALVALLTTGVTVSASADNVTGTAAVTGGTLSMSAADAPSFTATLNGTDQTASDPIDIDVADLTGSGSGWNLQITSTTFTNAGGKTLSTTATSISSASSLCDQGTCTAPTNAVTYPLTVPAGATPPTAVKLFNAAADTGMGDFTVTPTFEVDIPANTFAGTYTSTMSITIATGP